MRRRQGFRAPGLWLIAFATGAYALGLGSIAFAIGAHALGLCLIAFAIGAQAGKEQVSPGFSVRSEIGLCCAVC